MPRFRVFVLFVLSLLVVQSQAEEHIVGAHPGYVLDVDYERNSRSEEFNVFSSPPKEPKKDYQAYIFDERLSKEFKFQFRQQFGRSDAERNLINPGRYDEFIYETGVSSTLESDLERRQQFGEYMIKRLSEHHVDKFLKSEPSFRSVYELKDRLSKVNVEVKQGYKLDLNYSLSGNFFQVRLKNPHSVDARLFMQMDPQAFGPAEVVDTRLSLSFTPWTSYKLASDYFLDREGGRLTLSRYLGDGVGTSLTISRYPENLEFFQREETLGIIGISWTQ